MNYTRFERLLKGVVGLIGLCCLAGLLTIAAYCDYTEYKVSNALIVAGWCIGIVYRVFQCGVIGVAFWAGGVICSLLVLIVLFLFRMLGAGDIKLISVVGGFSGVLFTAKVFVWAVIFGSILSVIQCIRYRYLFIRLRYFAAYISDFVRTRKIKPYYLKERDGEEVIIPFSIAICMGFIVVSFLG